MKEDIEKSSFIKSGYNKREKQGISGNRLFNFSLAFLLILFSLPFFLIISLIIKLQDGGPVFYKQVRMGKNKDEFVLYKFRSLVPNADKITKGNPVESVHKEIRLMTPFGKFLRETRLDELPQLFNILKGEMDFIGPRPQRRAFYEKHCKHVKGYDKRFSVNAGLIGYSQLFIPHNAPRKVQALLDNHYITIKQNFMKEFVIVVYTIFTTLKISLKLIIKYFKYLFLSKILRKFDNERRMFERINQHKTIVTINYDDKSIEGIVLNMNEEALLLYSKEKLPKDVPLKLKIMKEIHFLGKKRVKVINCKGSLYKTVKGKNNTEMYVIKHEPISALNFYKLHQYFLNKSFASL